MATLPPPEPGSFSPQQPPPPGPRAEPVGTKPKRKRGVLIGGAVAVAVLAGVGIFVATRGDEDGGTATATTPETSSSPESLPDTTLETAPPSSVEPADPTTSSSIEIEIPAGAVDLGLGTFVPVPAGWSHSDSSDGVETISNGTDSLELHALATDVGQEPSSSMQSVADLLGDDAEVVSFSPVRNIGRYGDDLDVDIYRSYYAYYDSTGVKTQGALRLYLRSDGLAVVYNLHSDGDLEGLPDDEYAAFTDSIAAAPSLGPSVSLQAVDPFRLNSANSPVLVDGLVGFYPAPGFNVLAETDGRADVSNGVVDFTIQKLTAESSIDSALSTAQGLVAQTVQGITWGEVATFDPFASGVEHQGIVWSGSTLAGAPIHGAFDVVFDPTSSNGYVVLRSWPEVTPGDATEPNRTDGNFMYSSFVDSFTNIP